MADAVRYFNQMAWIAEDEPLRALGDNGKRRIDFADVVALLIAPRSEHYRLIQSV